MHKRPFPTPPRPLLRRGKPLITPPLPPSRRARPSPMPPPHSRTLSVPRASGWPPKR
jgi:hypothetical protein